MNFSINPMRLNPTAAMRRTGYRYQHKIEGTNKYSFVRELGSGGYPRFHMYAEMIGTRLDVHMHIDHKKHTYGEETRHHGEYDGEGPLGPEVERVKKVLGG